ncbi:Zinc finger CCCH domain-containing protein 29 [Sesamum alatum]|uniref:Zinc finger CCCH domain-containing protein 29 n=1 Tax=Sesamum alatum TaxID=300844 RepID=A0AAE2CVZ0_9LAMI|nr:Zinc finger CCCH domain-containing protein 29 [Sesamum alatum]
MCGGSKSKLSPFDLKMEAGLQDEKEVILHKNCSKLLEFAATDDLAAFICEVEERGCDVDEVSFWYGRSFGSRKMGFEERTPLMIASLYGSTEILKYVIGTGKVDVNRACGSDGATALHCAAAGGSWSSVEVVKLLIDASADYNLLDVNGKKPGDLIASCVKSSTNSKRRTLEMLLNGISVVEAGDQEEEEGKTPRAVGSEKKEYPVDVSLPDINNGIYGTDEFRMYSFKVKPCSRAYSHDWTECPFVHPGENARRRDPRKYHYTCVPCPEFKKGSCAKGDACEYAHGVFESWLHPAQYRTRLCKDETGCSRKVCFFAHKPEELRPLYASTGSAMPSPKSVSVNSLDLTTLSPLSLGSSSLMMPNTSTPPMSPSVTCSSPMGGSMWQNKMNLTPPTLQLPGSRLKSALSARDMELDMELLGLEKIRTQQRQQLVEEMASLSSPYSRIGDLKPTNLDDMFGSLDPTLLSQLQGLSPKFNTTPSSHLQSPTGLQIRQNANQLRASYPSNMSSSPSRKPSAYGFDSSAAVAAAVMNSRSSAFTKRSQSFIDRSGGSGVGYRSSLSGSANSPSLMPSKLSEWGSPDGKLDWGFNGEEVNKLRKSASFGIRSSNAATPAAMAPSNIDEPDVSWVNSLVKDVPASGTPAGVYGGDQRQGGVRDAMLQQQQQHWLDQMYIEQEQIVA